MLDSKIVIRGCRELADLEGVASSRAPACKTEEVSWVCVDSVVGELVRENHITSFARVVQCGLLQVFQCFVRLMT